MQPIAKDGRSIHPEVFAKLQSIGKQLEAHGYVERGRRPNLFVRDYKGVKFYADFGGTAEIPIWSNPQPLFYWFFERGSQLDLYTRRAMVLIEWRRLADVPKRTSWELVLGHGGEAGNEGALTDEVESQPRILLPARALGTAR